jgi:hypothetical protein
VPNTAPQLKRLIQLSEAYGEEQEGEGYGKKEWKFQGYTGEATEGQAYGSRHDGWCFQWSGHSAHRMAIRLREVPGAFNLTRCDYQVTERQKESQSRQAFRMYQRVRRFEARQPARKAVAVDICEHPRNGWTCYIGARTSPRFSRSYDKTAEQRGRVESGLVRHELQCNGEMAQKTYEACANSGSTHKFCIDIVTAHLQAHGIDDEWMRDASPMRMPSSYKPPDDERFLEHFGRCYAKRVNEMRRRGKLQAVVDALQLSNHVIIVEAEVIA